MPLVSFSLAPLYFCAQILWILIGFSAVGIFLTICRVYLNMDLLQELCSIFGLFWPRRIRSDKREERLSSTLIFISVFLIQFVKYSVINLKVGNKERWCICICWSPAEGTTPRLWPQSFFISNDRHHGVKILNYNLKRCMLKPRSCYSGYKGVVNI